jgi:hypothetical protein
VHLADQGSPGESRLLQGGEGGVALIGGNRCQQGAAGLGVDQ